MPAPSGTTATLEFRLVDVFAERAFAGNGLAVVFGAVQEPARRLLRIAQEFRQFETIFVEAPPGTSDFRARIFTVEEELPFAGHPVLGAAVALHRRHAGGESSKSWELRVGERIIRVATRREDGRWQATMDQGPAEFLGSLDRHEAEVLARALCLDPGDLLPLPVSVHSTGLPYLIVPVTPEGLARARITVDDLTARLADVSALFVYVFDPYAREGRTWDNAGVAEDVATGSAAGPAADYLRAAGLAAAGDELEIAQGRFVGRPSAMHVRLRGDGHLEVAGEVSFVGSGTLDALPDMA